MVNEHYYMHHAIALAKQGETLGEVPVGAVVVLNDEIIGEGFNTPITTHDPCAHAEINALRAAAKKMGNYRLLGANLYVTLEPCAMCATAMIHARINRLIFAADDEKTGAVKSHLQLLNQPMMNHQVIWQAGMLAEPAGQMLKNFFKIRRNK